MVKKQLLVGLVGLLIYGFVFMGSPINALAANKLKIGAIWSLTGPGSQVQVLARDAAVLAGEWINSKGGITVGGQKYEIEVIVEDNKATIEGSMSAATKLVHREKVKFITGMIVPAQYEAVQSVTEPNKVILSTGKSAFLNPKNIYTFSSAQAYTAPIPGLYDFLLKMYPSVKTMGFTCHDEAGSLGVLKVSRQVASGRGLKLFDAILTQVGAKDYYPVWTKLLKDKPDAVDIGLSFPDSIAANVRQGRELGFKGPIITPIGGDSSTQIKLIGKDGATDFIWGGFELRSPDNPGRVKEIVQIWGNRYKNPIDHAALVGYSSVWALAQAIEKAQSLDTTKVMKTWENMESIETPWGTGTMGGARTYGINHMVLSPVSISRLQNGKLESTQWFKPDIP